MPLESLSNIFEALEFTAVKHQYLRRGGYDLLPYINHLIKVANLIQQVGLGENTNLMLVAVLHDVVEDTETTPEEIVEKFGPEVGTAVSELSDDMALSYDERKKRQVQNAKDLSDLARVIRIADKICNIRDIMEYPLDWSLEKKLRYVKNSIEIVDQIKGTNSQLELILEREAAMARQEIENQLNKKD